MFPPGGSNGEPVVLRSTLCQASQKGQTTYSASIGDTAFMYTMEVYTGIYLIFLCSTSLFKLRMRIFVDPRLHFMEGCTLLLADPQLGNSFLTLASLS
jgi:hypothetical protein